VGTLGEHPALLEPVGAAIILVAVPAATLRFRPQAPLEEAAPAEARCQPYANRLTDSSRRSRSKGLPTNSSTIRSLAIGSALAAPLMTMTFARPPGRRYSPGDSPPFIPPLRNPARRMTSGPRRATAAQARPP